MIAATAVRLAGPRAHLVRRPAGVLHVYVGRLTRTGRAVPAARRPLCGTRARRLRVVEHTPDGSRLCHRCANWLEPLDTRPAPPRTREEYLTAHADTTLEQLAHEAEAATTAEELDAVAHLSLALFGHHTCAHTTIARPRGETTLHHLITRLRSTRFERDQRSAWSRTYAALAVVALETGKAERAEIRAERERRITALGFDTAQPNPRKARRR